MNEPFEIVRKRGDTKPIVFRLWADKAAGTVFPTDSCTFLFVVDPEKAPANDDNNILSLTGTAIGDGRVQFEMTALEADITPGTYYGELQVTDAGGYISTPRDGKFKIVQDIAK